MDAWIEVDGSGQLQALLLADPNGENQQTLHLRPGFHVVDRDVVVPSGVDLRFDRGAVLRGRGQLIVHGRIVAAAAPIFDVASGLTVRWVGRRTPEVYPQWWGAVGNGVDRDGAALAAMADSIRGDGPSVVVFRAGIYMLERTIALPSGKRYLAEGAEGDVVLRRHNDAPTEVALCSCGSASGDAPSRVTFRRLTFDGAQGTGALLQIVKAPMVDIECIVQGCGFTATHGAAVDGVGGPTLTLDGCACAGCEYALRLDAAVARVSIDRLKSTAGSGQVAVGPGVVTISDSELNGRISVKGTERGELRIADSTFAGLDVDLPDGRIGVNRSRLRSLRGLAPTASIAAARQVILQGCQIEPPATPVGQAGVTVRWAPEADGAVLIDGCALGTESAGHGRPAIIVVDGKGGDRRVDVVASSIGRGFKRAAEVTGARVSFRQVELQCTEGFRLARAHDGTAPTLRVASVQVMPVGSDGPGAYLRLVSSASTDGGPFVLQHDDVVLETTFNIIEAGGDELEMLDCVGGRELRGPPGERDARPHGLSGLRGDVFRPQNLLQTSPEWPTEWWCVRSGVGYAAVWQPVFQRPPAARV